MIKRQQIIVIGLGVYGATIATELTRLGHDVLGVDKDERRVDHRSEDITHAVIADVTEENALNELNAGDYDVGVVAIGRNLEAAILTTLHLRELGVETVWAKALTREHRRILERVGATRVVSPEAEMGQMVAQELNYPMVNNYIGLGDEEFVVEVVATESLDGITIAELMEEDPKESMVVLVKRGSKIYRSPEKSFELKQEDQLVIAGPLDELRHLARNL